MAQSNPLRALLQRLTSTPVEELPKLAYFLASSVSGALLAADSSAADQTALLHKLKTRISSLLQDRTKEGRFTAVVLAKAVIEAGGRDILVDSEPWIRGLIGILNKPDPVSTKKLVIATISRIFILTQQHPSLIREITTPLLPSFITACLSIIRPKTTKTEKGTRNILSPLLPIVLHVWAELLPHHPTTFRPFVNRFRPICLSLLSDSATPTSICEQAGILLLALHHSAPKNTAASEWLQLHEDIIRSVHATASELFRSVQEEWKPADTLHEPIPVISAVNNKAFPSIVTDSWGLSGWDGVHDGAQRLSRLLSLLTISVSSGTVQEISIRVSAISDICSRILALVIPKPGKDSPYTPKSNPEFGREERELLWCEIPKFHISCLKLLCVFSEVLGDAILPISKYIIEQIAWMFGAERDLEDIRESSYHLLRVFLPILGPAMEDTDFKTVSDIVHSACRDILAPDQNSERKTFEKGGKKLAINVDSFVGATKVSIEPAKVVIPSKLQQKAEDLISTALQYVPAQVIPNSSRVEIDRTAILVQHHSTLLASVLNPGKAQPGHPPPASVLPFLARCNHGLEVEGLLRPRMPVLTDRQRSSHELEIFQEAEVEMVEPAKIKKYATVLERQDELVEAPSPPAVPQELLQNISTKSLPTPQSAAFTAEKRSFTSMNEDNVNGLNGDTVLAPSLAEHEAKKARISVHTTTPSKTTRSADRIDLNPRDESHSVAEANDTPAVVLDPQWQTKYVIQPTSSTNIEIDTVKNSSKAINLAMDDGDSDSDVPEINIDPDTDEEEVSDDEMDE